MKNQLSTIAQIQNVIPMAMGKRQELGRCGIRKMRTRVTAKRRIEPTSGLRWSRGAAASEPRSQLRPRATGGMPGVEGSTTDRIASAIGERLHDDQHRPGRVETEQEVRADVVEQAVVDPRPDRPPSKLKGSVPGRYSPREQALTRGEMDPEIGVPRHEGRKQKCENDCKRREQEVGRREP